MILNPLLMTSFLAFKMISETVIDKLAELSLEKKTLIRVQQRKDEELVKLQTTIESSDGPCSFRSLETLNKSLEEKLKKQRDHELGNQKTIKIQDKRIRTLTAKLHSIAAAIRDLKGDAVVPLQTRVETIVNNNNIEEECESPSTTGGIPVEVYEFMETEVARLKNLINQKDSEILEKNEEIENLSRQGDVMKRAQVSSTKKLKTEISQLNQDIETMQREIEVRDDETVRREAVLKTEIYSLRNELARLQGVIAEQAETLRALGN
ncbi:hypothetical protein RCL1_008739 [Eukaryota sp. TZLM3-RCL]